MSNSLETISCPICGGRQNELFVRAQDRLGVTDTQFSLVACNACGLVYQNPRIPPAEIGRFYNSTYFSSRPGRHTAKAHVASHRERKKSFLIEHLCKKPGMLLDVGCANGDFLLEMRRHGWIVEGVEQSQDACEYCRSQNGLAVFNGHLAERPDNGARFDVITMWAVLPHIPNPLTTLEHCEKLLNPGGICIICCANIESLAYLISRELWGHLDQPRHYCLYSPSTLKRLLSCTGFCCKNLIFDDSIYHSNITIPGLRKIQKLSTQIPSGMFRKITTKIMNVLNNILAAPLVILGRWVRKGGIMIVVASKSKK